METVWYCCEHISGGCVKHRDSEPFFRTLCKCVPIQRPNVLPYDRANYFGVSAWKANFFFVKMKRLRLFISFVNYHAEHTVHWTLVASSPVCCNRCCCRHCLLLNVFAHTSHIKTVLLLWTPLICDWRIDFVINDFGQCSQMNFFSSEKWRCFWCWESWYRLTKL